MYTTKFNIDLTQGNVPSIQHAFNLSLYVLKSSWYVIVTNKNIKSITNRVELIIY